MKALVFHDVGDIRLDDVPEPQLQEATDAIVRLTASAICGTDLHMIRGTMGGMVSGTVLGHEGVGVVEQLGDDVRNVKVGDRVVLPSTLGCGSCSYCRAGYFAQCDNANPNGPLAGTSFYGGPQMTGPFDGLQAEKARVPYAHTNLVKLPDEVPDDQAIMLSDIFPTGWFGADNAEIKAGDTVAVLGCGPVGLFAIVSAHLQGAGRVLAVDQLGDRLDQARALGAETIDFSVEEAPEALRRLTGGIGPDRIIDAVGVDAEPPGGGSDGGTWVPGHAPAQALTWAVDAVAKAGTISIIGVYPPEMEQFPIGMAMNKNLTLKMGNCNHRRYIPELIELVRSGAVDPSQVLTQVAPEADIEQAYEAFDRRESGWIKVAVDPADT